MMNNDTSKQILAATIEKIDGAYAPKQQTDHANGYELPWETRFEIANHSDFRLTRFTIYDLQRYRSKPISFR